MADSDDYLFDDLDLDAEALAVLDAEESKFITLTQKAPARAPAPPSPPAPKRQKTAQGWVPTGRVQRAPSTDDLEDLPEISVRDDGSYGLNGRPGPSAASMRTMNGRAPSAPAFGTEARPNGAPGRPAVVPRPAQSNGHVPSRPIVNHAPPPGANSRRPVPSRAASRPPGSQSIPGNNAGVNGPVNQPRYAPRPPVPLPPPPVQTPGAKGAAADRMQAEIATLRAQLQELSTANAQTREALQKAETTRYAKEGEVTLLRKNMEKVSEEHAASLDKLRAAKEAAEAAQAQVQREMKEEMERLRTQFTFRQHELETSARKAPWSARGKRAGGMEPPPTPIPQSSQMRAWRQAGSSGSHLPAFAKTPSKPFAGFGRDSPKKARAPSTLTSSQISRPASDRGRAGVGMLPGFVNAFAPSSPSRSPKLARGAAVGKGKGKEPAPAARADSWADDGDAAMDDAQTPSRTRGRTAPFANRNSPPLSPPSSPTLRGGDIAMGPPSSPLKDADGINLDSDGPLGGDADAYGTHGADDADAGSEDAEELEDVEDVDWRAELQRIVFSHTMAASTALTFQGLLSTTLPLTLAAPLREEYVACCARILQILGAISKNDKWDCTVDEVAPPLVGMLRVLLAANSLAQSTALLDMLTMLCFHLPSFSHALLSAGGPHIDKRGIVGILSDAIKEQASQFKDEVESEPRALVTQSLRLLEALTWNLPDGLEERFVAFIRGDGVLESLLAATRPTWLIRRTTRFLTLLASRPSLFRALLSFPESPTDHDQATKNYAKIPHIEALCLRLVDHKRRDEEAPSMRIAILMFFAELTTVHPDAHTILLESEQLVPAIILFLTRLTASVFEEEDALTNSPALASSTIRTLHQTLFLLHHFLLGVEHDVHRYLTQKFHLAYTYKPFNGLLHMFNVTFGRLSYADPPEFASEDDRKELEAMADLARDLLEIVVEGPEADLVWSVFQGDADANGSETDDDEEMGARLLDANVVG